MRRSALFLGVLAVALMAFVAPTSAGTPPTIVVSPNPVVAGEDITITNAPLDNSTCEAGGSKDSEGSQANTVTVQIVDSSATIVFEETASPDEGGNWQVVTQLTEPGEYTVLAVCNNGGGGGGLVADDAEAVGPFTYQPVDLVVTEQVDPEPEPPTGGPLVPVPQDIQPAFTG